MPAVPGFPATHCGFSGFLFSAAIPRIVSIAAFQFQIRAIVCLQTNTADLFLLLLPDGQNRPRAQPAFSLPLHLRNTHISLAKIQFFWDPAIFLSLTPLLLVKNNAMDLHNITVLLPFPAAVLACPVVPAVPSFPLAYFFVYTFPFLLSPDFLVTIPM